MRIYRLRLFDYTNFRSESPVYKRTHIPRSCCMPCDIYDHWCIPKGLAPVVSLIKSHSEVVSLSKSHSRAATPKCLALLTFPSSAPRKRTRSDFYSGWPLVHAPVVIYITRHITWSRYVCSFIDRWFAAKIGVIEKTETVNSHGAYECLLIQTIWLHGRCLVSTISGNGFGYNWDNHTTIKVKPFVTYVFHV